MGQGVVHGHRGQLARPPAPERAARGGEPAGGPPVVVAAVGTGRGQALVDGAVLGVDRDDLGPRGPPGPLDDRGPGDQRLLVGQGQPPAGLEGGQGHRQAGEAHHAVDHHLGGARRRGQALGAGQHLGPGRDPAATSAARAASPMATSSGRSAAAWASRASDRALGGQGHHPEALGLGGDHVEAWVPIEPVDPTRLTV